MGGNSFAHDGTQVTRTADKYVVDLLGNGYASIYDHDAQSIVVLVDPDTGDVSQGYEPPAPIVAEIRRRWGRTDVSVKEG